MIEIEEHGDITRLVMTTRRSRLVGYSVSAYLVRGVLVDCGFHAVRDELAALLRSHRPRGVLITHHHEDHAGNIDLVARAGIPIGVAPDTLALVRETHPTRFYRRFTWGAMPPLRAPIVPLEGDEVPQLLPMPGHASDHHVVWLPDERVLIAGDLFLGVKVRIAHPDERPRELVRSLRAAAALGPRRLFDAHRGLVADPVGALEAKADWLEGVLTRIDARIAEGWSDRAIVREVLGREELVGYMSGGEYSRASLVRARRGEGAG